MNEIINNLTPIQRQKLIEKYRPSLTKTKRRTKCLRCEFWIDKDMKSCQPCEAAKPIYSRLHKFNYE